MTKKVGTPDYVAPEVMQGAIVDTFKLDMWSFGCLVYFMLLGRSPFEQHGDDVRSLCLAVVNGMYTIPPNKLSDEGKCSSFGSQSFAAVDFLKRLMCVDPLKRLSAAEAAKHTWIQVT